MRLWQRLFSNRGRDVALARRLDFVIAGAQTAGTTALHYFLEQHPQIVFPRKQELHFFDNEERFARGGNHDQELAEFFPSRANNAGAVGECTPNYIYWPPALPRLRDHNPEVKLILTLRNPVERAFSHWNMQRERKVESLDFREAIAAEATRAKELRPSQLRRVSYVERGRYASQLRRAFELFPREQFHLIKSDRLRADPKTVITEVCQFLGVPPLSRLKVREKNATPYLRKMTAEEREMLRSIFAEEIAQLEELLGWNCRDWK